MALAMAIARLSVTRMDSHSMYGWHQAQDREAPFYKYSSVETTLYDIHLRCTVYRANRMAVFISEVTYCVASRPLCGPPDVLQGSSIITFIEYFLCRCRWP